MKDIFISFSSKDKELADKLVNDLESCGYTCWISHRNAQVGIEYASSIVKAIRQCKVTLLLLTKNSNVSRHVLNEINCCINANKPIITYKISNFNICDALEYYIGNIHWITATKSYNYDFSILKEAVSRHININANNNIDTNNIINEINIETNNYDYNYNANNKKTSKIQKFDEKKLIKYNDIEIITINSQMVDINVSATNFSDIYAHLYGEAEFNGNISFDFENVNHELIIKVNFNGNYYNGNLKLDVAIPKKIFKIISTNSTSANITFSENILTNFLKVKSKSGNVQTNAIFTNATIATMSGDITLSINAKENIFININTISGDVSTTFNNIGYINLSTNSKSGVVTNHHKDIAEYTANVAISTISGNIIVS